MDRKTYFNRPCNPFVKIAEQIISSSVSVCFPPPGPDYIEQLKIKWDSLPLLPVFSHTIMDKSAEVGLKSMGNTTLVRKNSLGSQRTVTQNSTQS